MGDFSLKQNILDELAFDPEVDPANIGVIVDHGVVTLTGHVGSYTEKLAAEKATRRVKGVRAIAEEIEVRVPNHKQTADDEIAKRVADILRWNSSLPDGAIQVSVHDGWVELEGEVDWRFQRTAAQEQVAQLSGLVGIINNITVKNKPASSEIQEQIDDAFRRSAIINPQSVRVIVRDGGQVDLEGDVYDWTEHSAAEDIAWATPGVSSVQNHLRIVC